MKKKKKKQKSNQNFGEKFDKPMVNVLAPSSTVRFHDFCTSVCLRLLCSGLCLNISKCCLLLSLTGLPWRGLGRSCLSLPFLACTPQLGAASGENFPFPGILALSRDVSSSGVTRLRSRNIFLVLKT